MTADGPVVLKAEGLGWSVRGRALVADVSFEVGEGEMLGLVGPNGSGKSTLLRLLSGVLAPHRGSVHLCGRALAALGRRTAAQRLAVVSQQAETADRLTVRDAVELGRTPFLSALRPWGAADDAAVNGALAAVDMLKLAAREWATLSGGERQRAHIARALAQQPRLLLLDEPTNHLDIHHQLGILELVASLPLTSVVALHDLNQAMRCDRVLVMQAGGMVALGPPASVLTPELLRRVFDVRAASIIDPADGHAVIRFHLP